MKRKDGAVREMVLLPTWDIQIQGGGESQAEAGPSFLGSQGPKLALCIWAGGQGDEGPDRTSGYPAPVYPAPVPISAPDTGSPACLQLWGHSVCRVSLPVTSTVNLSVAY